MRKDDIYSYTLIVVIIEHEDDICLVLYQFILSMNIDRSKNKGTN